MAVAGGNTWLLPVTVGVTKEAVQALVELSDPDVASTTA